MNRVHHVPRHKPQARPVQAPCRTSLPHLRFKAVPNVIRISPPHKIPASRKLFTIHKLLKLRYPPTPMANPLQRLIPPRRRLLRLHLKIDSPIQISLLPPASREIHHPPRVTSLPREIIRHLKLRLIHRPQTPLQPSRLLQPRLPFRIQFQPSRSFRASGPFEAHPMPRVPRAQTFRSAA